MKTLRWGAALALVVVFALLSGKTSAQSLPPGTSDELVYLVGDQPARTLMTIPELPGGVDSSDKFPFNITSPIVIEIMGTESGTRVISDRLTISALSGTFTSDSSENGLTHMDGAIESFGETHFAVLRVLTTSFPAERHQPSDSWQVLSRVDGKHGITLKKAKLKELLLGAPESDSYDLASTNGPLVYEFLSERPEPGTSIISDRISIDTFTVTFESDGDPGGFTHMDGAIQVNEAELDNHGPAFRLDAKSDHDAVPEPSALSLLPAGLLALGGILWRIRRR